MIRLQLPEHDVVKPGPQAAPRVSVIVPAYNVGGYLREAVMSLLAQSWSDLEVLVIDDASTDDAVASLAELRDPRLAIHRLRRNGGLSAARNAGLALARAPYIALLDGDDTSLPHRIATQLGVLQARPEVALVGCLVNRTDAAGRLVSTGRDTWRLPDEALKPLMLFANPFPAVYMLRADAVPAHGFQPMYAEDYALAAEVAERHEVALVREPLVNYRLSPDGIMASKLERVAEGALVTQRRLLLAAGVAATAIDPAFLAKLMYFGRQPRGALSQAWLAKVRTWLQLVLHANDASARYPAQALRRAAARVWDLALLEATKAEGLRPGLEYMGRLLPFLAGRGDASLRMRCLAHSLLSIGRGPLVKADPFGRDGGHP